MYKNIKSKEEGFTIIEVVLVLAIAALIFLIVFLALPQLQKNRRDTQRRNDGGRIVSQLESWAGDHNGTYPTDAEFIAGFKDNYVDGDITTPENGSYTLQVAAPTAVNQVQYLSSGDNGCDGTALGAREVGVKVGLESGEYCQDNK